MVVIVFHGVVLAEVVVAQAHKTEQELTNQNGAAEYGDRLERRCPLLHLRSLWKERR